MGGIQLCELSPYGRYPVMGAVPLWEVSSCVNCPLMGGIQLCELSPYGRYPVM